MSEIKAASLDPSTSDIVVDESAWAVVGRLSARCAAYASTLPFFKVDIFSARLGGFCSGCEA
jgi:hypothetical protein